ncbi:exodeoxyribonuclease VII large subunit [Alistipes sp.]|uniref:exodeoxyribonuclease VII large subunit n=1 Tax=Alistipes sp. TaxID=1872444 RepID=UPI003A873032
MIAEQHITLTELQRRVRLSLEERFALPLWVSAEIAEIKVNYSGHCYLELVEKGTRDGVPRAQARAVIWRSQYARIAAGFEAETGQRLAAGMRILARASVSYHEVYGFSLQLLDVDPSYTLGDMERQRQQTIARLQAEGVWEMNRQQELPVVVQRIAVVSSRRAAGYQDFCNELAKSPYRFELTLFDAVVQGAAAEDSLVDALDRVAEAGEAFDAVAIIRGGGSSSDLNCFNAYRLCNHVAQFPLPVITGIGHDKDTSVADLVAHTALKTPTAVAAWFVERMAQTDGWLAWAGLQAGNAAQAVIHTAAVGLERLGAALVQQSERLLQSERNRLGRAEELLRTAPADLLRNGERRLTAASELLLSYSVERVLRRGFAVVRRGGEALRSVEGLAAGDRIDITLADGEVQAAVVAFTKQKQDDNG